MEDSTKDLLAGIMLLFLCVSFFLLSIGLLVGMVGMSLESISDYREKKRSQIAKKEDDLYEEEHLTPCQKWLRSQPGWVLHQIAAGVPAEKFGWRDPDETTLH